MRHTLRWFLIAAGFLPFTHSFALGADRMDAAEIRAKAQTVLAQLDGEIRVPGLSSPVEVLRDRWGVPHIYARNQRDLFFAQGFVAAQDRLFQIDTWRRQATGEMAEAFGERFVEHDRFARLVRFRGDLDAEWNSYSPDAREIAAAFTAGINAYVEQLGDRLPIEFQILGTKPKTWRPEDVLGRMSGITMTRNFSNELARAELIQTVGLERARKLARTDPVRDFAPVPGLDLAGLDLAVLASYNRVTDALRLKDRDIGSNNWVVSGRLTESGKPLLANDPHRAIQLPALRYLVHLHAPGWHCIGAGEPALPGVAVGHNDRIAWGFTVVNTDQSDLYVEELDPADATRYKIGDRFEPLQTLRERIAVRGKSEPVEVELRFSRHGPILQEDVKRHRAIALRWSGNEPGGAAYLACLGINRARNWPEFRRALTAWKLPSENMIYADVDGNIGWTATALTPIRRGWDGLLPVPGASGQYEWQGFLSVEQLPSEFNPDRGHITTANANILPAGYDREITYEWSQPYRQARLRTQMADHVAAGKKFTIADCRRLQHDDLSLPGQRLSQLAAGFDPQDNRLRPYVRMLAAWDGVMSRDSAGAALYAVWLQELGTAFFGKHTPATLHKFLRGNRGIDVLLDAVSQPDADWFGENPAAARDKLLERTLDSAVVRCRKLMSDDERKWSWGQLHTVTFRHALSTLGPEYEKALNLGPLPKSGDGYTPNAASHADNFEQTSGASYRQIFDLADWDRGVATSTPGQSGQPTSPHYADLMPLWSEGQYFPLKFSRPAVEAVTIHRLTLRP